MTITNIILLVIIGVLLLFLYISYKTGVHALVRYCIARDMTINILNTIKHFISDFNVNHKDITLELKPSDKPGKIIELTEHPIIIKDLNTMDGEISIVKVRTNPEDTPKYMYMIENKYGILLITKGLFSMSFTSIDKALKGLAELTKVKTLIKIKQNG